METTDEQQVTEVRAPRGPVPSPANASGHVFADDGKLPGSSYVRLLWPTVLVCLIVTASGGQIAGGPRIVGIDKVAHLLFFGLIATHLCRYPANLRDRLHWKQGLFAVFVTTLFGLSDELHQSFNPYRTFDLVDLLADFSGAALAVALYQHCRPYRNLLELRVLRWRQS